MSVTEGNQTIEKPWLFKPGNPGSPGRPSGSKDKPYLRPGYWHDLIIAEWNHLKPAERASIAMKGFATVMPKNVGPTTQEESLENADAAFKMLKMLQEVSGGNNSRIGATSDTSGMEDGGSAPQTESPAAPSV